MRVGVIFKETEKLFDDYAEAMNYIEELMTIENVSDGDIEIKYYV